MNERVPAYPQPDNAPPVSQPPGGPKDKFPVGLIFIIILTGMAVLGSLMTVVNPMIIIGTYVITGLPAFAYGVVQLGVYVALFVWLIQRKEWGRILGIVVSVYNMLLMAITFLSFVYLPDETMAAYDSVFPGYSEIAPSSLLALTFGLTAMLSWLVGAAVILYLYFKKRHFRA